MTEWNALGYEKISALQQTMAAEALSLLALQGDEHILDLGCGNGRVTAGIASLVPRGSVVGVDASTDMIALATKNFGTETYPNLRFEVSDIRAIRFVDEFDLVVSFNALHWIPQQKEALKAIRKAMKPGGKAQLRLVPKGKRKSLEDVLEETRSSSKWASFYDGYQDPYLHLTPEEYAVLAERTGLRVASSEVNDKSWDFGSREGFFAFGSVTFVEWTRRLPEETRPEFIRDVLDRYSAVAGDDHAFRFYQMDIRLTKA
jgi:trans-aconitate 2-methyltransferase